MNDEIVVYSPIGCPALNIRLSGETLWLTMQQLAVVFDVDRSVIGKYIRNIYKTGELDRESTWAKIAQVQIEGKRQITRTRSLALNEKRLSRVEQGVETIVKTLLPPIQNRRRIGFNPDDVKRGELAFAGPERAKTVHGDSYL